MTKPRSIIEIKYNGRFVARGVYETLNTTVEMYNILCILIKNIGSIKKLYPKNIPLQGVKLLETLGLGLRSEEIKEFDSDKGIQFKKENPAFGYITLQHEQVARRRQIKIEVDIGTKTFDFNAFKKCTATQAKEYGYTNDKLQTLDADLNCISFADYRVLSPYLHSIFKVKNRVGIWMPI